jgi:hypothetical protein
VVALSVHKITLWRAVIENRPGALAEVLEPVAAAGTDPQVVMGYREPGQPNKAVIKLFPVRGRKLTEAVEGAGLTDAAIRPCSDSRATATPLRQSG